MKTIALSVLIRPGLALFLFGFATWWAQRLERFIPPGKFKDVLYRRYS